eukprot:TRINITY_DN3785_c1_g1_i8.p1 TRINITY_DN3785_c1_g1~~TRINITY_DN3785_c1_g1_i8.p1  ORF type:complete len:1142 (+),score=277.26 TRINITY_DN3785_c1_g1_i8:90-3428(+)
MPHSASQPRGGRGASSAPEPCWHWLQGCCRNGDSCPHPHDPAQLNTWRTRLCRHWEQPGGCRRGERCKFAHGTEQLRGTAGPDDAERPPPRPSDEETQVVVDRMKGHNYAQGPWLGIGLNSYQRMKVHEAAKELGLHHDSQGEGLQRAIVVWQGGQQLQPAAQQGQGAEGQTPAPASAPAPAAAAEKGELRWPPRRTLFVGGLHVQTRGDDMLRHFGEQAARAEAFIDPKWGWAKSVGFVCFATQQAAEVALANFQGSRLHGRSLSLEWHDHSLQKQGRSMSAPAPLVQKKKMCKWWKLGSGCPAKGMSCRFAHGEDDLTLTHPRELRIARKTKLCDEWTHNGSCRYGQECRHAHGDAELRGRHPLAEAPPAGTACRAWQELGACRFGETCEYAHIGPARQSVRFRASAPPPQPGPAPAPAPVLGNAAVCRKLWGHAQSAGAAGAWPDAERLLPALLAAGGRGAVLLLIRTVSGATCQQEVADTVLEERCRPPAVGWSLALPTPASFLDSANSGKACFVALACEGEAKQQRGRSVGTGKSWKCFGGGARLRRVAPGQELPPELGSKHRAAAAAVEDLCVKERVRCIAFVTSSTRGTVTVFRPHSTVSGDEKRLSVWEYKIAEGARTPPGNAAAPEAGSSSAAQEPPPADSSYLGAIYGSYLGAIYRRPAPRSYPAELYSTPPQAPRGYPYGLYASSPPGQDAEPAPVGPSPQCSWRERVVADVQLSVPCSNAAKAALREVLRRHLPWKLLAVPLSSFLIIQGRDSLRGKIGEGHPAACPDLSGENLLSIFHKDCSSHDGAVIVRMGGNVAKVERCGCYVEQVADEVVMPEGLPSQLGESSRVRAAVRLARSCDACAVITDRKTRAALVAVGDALYSLPAAAPEAGPSAWFECLPKGLQDACEAYVQPRQPLLYSRTEPEPRRNVNICAAYCFGRSLPVRQEEGRWHCVMWCRDPHDSTQPGLRIVKIIVFGAEGEMPPVDDFAHGTHVCVAHHAIVTAEQRPDCGDEAPTAVLRINAVSDQPPEARRHTLRVVSLSADPIPEVRTVWSTVGDAGTYVWRDSCKEHIREVMRRHRSEPGSLGARAEEGAASGAEGEGPAPPSDGAAPAAAASG